jgi:hypothetical protein
VASASEARASFDDQGRIHSVVYRLMFGFDPSVGFFAFSQRGFVTMFVAVLRSDHG